MGDSVQFTTFWNARGEWSWTLIPGIGEFERRGGIFGNNHKNPAALRYRPYCHFAHDFGEIARELFFKLVVRAVTFQSVVQQLRSPGLQAIGVIRADFVEGKNVLRVEFAGVVEPVVAYILQVVEEFLRAKDDGIAGTLAWLMIWSAAWAMAWHFRRSFSSIGRAL